MRSYYYSGAGNAGFGINEKLLFDSLTITLDGYEPVTKYVRTDQWQTIILKPTADAVSKSQPKLISLTKDYTQNTQKQFVTSDETYFQLVENDYVNAIEYPSTGYSLNVNKASYSNVRRFLNMGSIVPPDAIRTEEMYNYFNLNYQSPKGGNIFDISSQLTSCPWNKYAELLFINVCAKKLDLDKIPPGNFVFLIDVSGSMDMPNRLPLLKAAFQLFTKNLRNIDTVSIVTYGGFVQLWLPPTSGAEQAKILKSIEELEAEGDTPGESAIKIAYNVAKSRFIKGGNNRVILATDGDFNVGERSEKALDELISNERKSGVYLTCLGVGMGNFKDSKLQTLAKKGNGNYAYLDDIHEAERVLVKELTQTFYAVADDVFMNVKFSPELVSQYRLIGFDNKKEALSDTTNHLDGGEMGSGGNVLALFEITPTEKGIQEKSTGINVAQLELKYKNIADSLDKKIEFNLNSNFVIADSLDKDYRFGLAVAAFALKLKKSKYYAEQSWSEIKKIATSAADPNNYLEKQFLNLIDKASKLYVDKKKRKLF